MKNHEAAASLWTSCFSCFFFFTSVLQKKTKKQNKALLLLDSMVAVLIFFEVREQCDGTQWTTFSLMIFKTIAKFGSSDNCKCAHFRYKVDIIPLACFFFIHQRNPFVKLRSAYQSARALGGQTGSTNTPPPSPQCLAQAVRNTTIQTQSHTYIHTHKHRVESIIAVQGYYPKMLMWRIWPVCSAYILKAFRHHQNIERHDCIRLKLCCYHTKPGSSGHFFSSPRQKKKMRGGKREENKAPEILNASFCTLTREHT